LRGTLPTAWRGLIHGSAVAGRLAATTPPRPAVLTTRQRYEPDWLVASADEAAAEVRAAGGQVVTEPFDIPVGRLAVVADPFGNALVLLDLSKGHYVTDAAGNVTAVTR
jgi:predicted enzyme related to lactoylglutathione lyase